MFIIGEFSHLSRVSVRMLRHYDRLGLLTPSQTDQFTGYRYYSADQRPRLNRILTLRGLGFSLEQITGMLNDRLSTEQLLGMLKGKRAEVEEQMLGERQKLDRLEVLRCLPGRIQPCQPHTGAGYIAHGKCTRDDLPGGSWKERIDRQTGRTASQIAFN